MHRPIVTARIVKRDDLAGGGIDARDVWSLGPIAAWARKAEVGQRRSAAVLFGDDVVDLKRQLVCRLRQATILASVTRSGAYSRRDVGWDRQWLLASRSLHLKGAPRLRLQDGDDIGCVNDIAVFGVFRLGECARLRLRREFV